MDRGKSQIYGGGDLPMPMLIGARGGVGRENEAEARYRNPGLDSYRED